MQNHVYSDAFGVSIERWKYYTHTHAEVFALINKKKQWKHKLKTNTICIKTLPVREERKRGEKTGWK